ncbi:MAG: non-ribosomal peptide synthetase, partial [Actinomycetota bacterium]|nr:non-ribosomal peptide synthetase [Actinomycetota bacterium]
MSADREAVTVTSEGSRDQLHIADLIDRRAQANAMAPAICHAGRASLTYAGLQRQMAEVGAALRQLGLGRTPRVAVALPGGPELAAAILGVAASATCVPLDPASPRAELEHLLDEARVDCVLVCEGRESPAAAIAERRGTPVLAAQTDPLVPAGAFRLSLLSSGAPAGSPASLPGQRRSDETAVVLHTSGTTGKPKIVPLSHRNVCTSAHNIASSMQLTEDDRCLNVLPMYYSHGLMSPLMATIAAGASVICPRRFEVMKFFRLLAELAPTWYSAVPPIHREIVKAAPTFAGPLARSRLRFVRSASAPLPPELHDALESTFHVPVIESYGMTETASIVTSNPLPPGRRKKGSVGVSIGCDVAIMTGSGSLLPPGQRGEIGVRGPTVTFGYENDPIAKDTAFVGGWFRTGDEGFVDEEGYLFITGRMKEIVNRGGAKVSPVEVDDALRRHPSVLEAASFGVPHTGLGEDLAAAVVAKGDAVITEEQLRRHLAATLSPYKVPSRIFFVDEIPTTHTGKIRRRDLAELLAPAGGASVVAAGTEAESRLVDIWSTVLGLPAKRVGTTDNFFDLGGTSLRLAEVRSALQRELGWDIPLLE